MTGGSIDILKTSAERQQFVDSNAPVSLFRSNYHKHTNFSIEPIEIPFDTRSVLSETSSTTLRIKIPRNADMISKLYVIVKLPEIYSTQQQRFRWTEKLGFAMIEEANITIGGQKIDTITYDWMDIYYKSHMTEEKYKQLLYMIGNRNEMIQPSLIQYSRAENEEFPTIFDQELHVPLPFWFTKRIQSALPLCCLQKHEVFVEIIFRPVQQLFTVGGTYSSPDYASNELLSAIEYTDQRSGSTKTLADTRHRMLPEVFCQQSATKEISVSMLAEYIYLEDKERKQLVDHPQTFLIDTIQKTSFVAVATSNTEGATLTDVKVGHVSKGFYWYYRRTDVSESNMWLRYSNILFVEEEGHLFRDTIMKTASFSYNGSTRIAEQGYQYFHTVQSFQHHTSMIPNGVLMYSFSQNPEQFQPTGNSDLTGIRKMTIHSVLHKIPLVGVTSEYLNSSLTYDLVFFNHHYNFLELSSGLGSLRFAE